MCKVPKDLFSVFYLFFFYSSPRANLDQTNSNAFDQILEN